VIRTQISLDDHEMAGLRELSAQRDVSIASLVREAVARLLADSEAQGSPRRRALAAVGAYRWGGSGRDHDADLADAYGD
jgi:hypothetical protein